MQKPVVHILLLVAVGFFAYSNTFYAPFQDDDTTFIVKNPAVRDIGKVGLSQSRAVGFLTFALNYRLHGFDVRGFHVFNLAIHILNSILVYRFVLLVSATPFLSSGASDDGSRASSYRLVALFSGLLFVSHPVQTGAVTFIWQRVTSLAAFFYLLSVVMYLKFRAAEQQSSRSAARKKNTPALLRCLSTAPIFYCSSLLSAVLAMKTKETAFTLPFMVALIELSFFGKKPGPGFQISNPRRFLYILPFLLTLAIIPLSIIGPSLGIYGTEWDMGEKIRQDELRDIAEMSRYAYLLTQFRVIVTYIRLLLLPVNQNTEYDYPLYDSFLNPNVFLSFLGIVAIIAFAVYIFHKSRAEKQLRMAAFGIFWFFIALSVESSIIPIKTIINEHRVYLPSVGAFIAFSCGVSYIAVKGRRIKFMSSPYVLYYLLMAALAVALSVASYRRNNIWGEEIAYWNDVAMKSPNKVGAHLGLGIAYHNKGRLEEAVREYQAALKLAESRYDPGEINTIRYNLGVAYYSQGKLDEAINEYLKVLEKMPDNPDVRNNLGIAYRQKGLMSEAEREFKRVLATQPANAFALDNLRSLPR